MKKVFLIFFVSIFCHGCLATIGTTAALIHASWTAAKDQHEIREYFFGEDEKETEKQYFYTDQPPWVGDLVVTYPSAQIIYRARFFKTEHSEDWISLDLD
jgi:hypothetical protein